MRHPQTPPDTDTLATATQLEADLALTEWQHNRGKAPAERLHDYDECARARAYEATLDIVRRMVA